MIKEYSPLHEAIYTGNIDKMHQLLSSSTDASSSSLIHVCTERNESVLHYAMCHNRKDMIRPLIQQYGANVNKITNQSISVPAMSILVGAHVDCLEEFLIVCKEQAEKNTSGGDEHEEEEEEAQVKKRKYGLYDINKKNMFGETVLHVAAKEHSAKACELLLRFGASVNEVTNEGYTALDFAMEEVEDDHHHHHHHHDHDHEHGDDCCHHDHGHDHDDDDEQAAQERKQQREALETKRQECIEVIKTYGGVEGDNKKSMDDEKVMSPSEAPQFVKFGFSNDSSMMMHETRFGGALWADALQVFYSGKKPKVGYACEVKLIIVNDNGKGPKGHPMIAIIYSVSDDFKTIKATGVVPPQMKDDIKELSGEWDITLEFSSSPKIPYVLKSLVPQTDATKTYETLLKAAHEAESKNGRKIKNKLTSSQKQCTILKGSEGSDNPNAKVIVGINLIQSSRLVYEYEDGTQEVVQGPTLPYVFQSIVEQNLELEAQGKPGISIKVNGQAVVFDLVDDDDEDVAELEDFDEEDEGEEEQE